MSQATGLPGINQPVNLMISNVPGPSAPVYLAGARQRAQFPIAGVKDGIGLNITVFSYQDSLEIGIVVDREQVDDPWPILGALRAGLRELRDLADVHASDSRPQATSSKESPMVRVGQVIPISICSGFPTNTTNCAPCCATCARRRSRRTPPTSTSIRAFPEEALKALDAAGFSAVHVPEEYGGQGADAVATCIVIEEVARVDASASLIPGVNKLGTMGLILAGSDELKKQVLPTLASGEAMASYALVGAGGRQRRGRDAHPGSSGRRPVDPQRHQGWITNGGKSTWYTVMAVTDPDKGANGISAFMVHKDDEGFTVGPKERKLGIKGSPTTELYFENCRIPGDRIIGEPGTGFKTALATLDHTRPTIGAQAVGIAQGALDAAIAYTKERKQFGKSISDFQGVQFMLADMAMKIEAARLMVYTAAARAERGEPALGLHLVGVEVLRLRRGDGGDHRRGAVVRRRRLHPRLPGRADDARRQDHPDLRGHQPDSAGRDGARAAGLGAIDPWQWCAVAH